MAPDFVQQTSENFPKKASVFAQNTEIISTNCY